MRSNKRLLLGFSLLLAIGCETTQAPVVYVDLDSVLAATESPALNVDAPTDGPNGVGSRSVSVPSVPGRSIELDADRASRALDANRARAERQLSQELGSLYLRELKAEEANLLRAAEPESRALLEGALTQIRPIFERYAVRRAYPAARLAAIVGFPDPNPKSLPPTKPLNTFASARTAEAEQLRRQLAELDAEYDRDVASVLAASRSASDSILTDVRAAISLLRSNALERAEREASATIARSHQELEQSAMKDARVQTSSEEGASTQLPAVDAPSDAPKIRSSSVARDVALKSLKSEAEVWAAARGYELSAVKRGSREVTAEFLAWKKEQHL